MAVIKLHAKLPNAFENKKILIRMACLQCLDMFRMFSFNIITWFFNMYSHNEEIDVSKII